MTEPGREEAVEPIKITEADINEAIAACDGDVIAAIKAPLILQ